MTIKIEVAREVSAEAFARVQRAAAVTAAHDICFQGRSIEVSRGDFTSIVEDCGHPDAQSLFSLVHRVIEEPFERDPEGFLLVPIAEGGVMVDTSDCKKEAPTTRAQRFRDRWAVVQVPLDPAIRDALDDIARDRRVTRSDLIREAVERWLRDDAKRLLSRDRSSKNAAYSP